MKSLILYGSQTKLTPMHRLVRETPPYFVRAVPFDGDDLEAIEAASPLAGETVLNAVPYDA